MTAAAEHPENRRKRLLWRASHRGIREMDLILGGFAAARIETMTATELDQLEAVIDLPDRQLLDWATRQEPVPAELRSRLLNEMLDFRP
ncbi:MAG: FAD assembly factor SdhE [Hyphomicrobiales bacterium]